MPARCAAVFALLTGAAAGPALSWFSASDTHLGHDSGKGENFTTSYTKNTWAINEMNSIPSSGAQWPASLGGGPVLEPAGVTVSGDLIDGGVNPESSYDGCAQWANFTALYGLNGTDGLLKYRAYEGRGNHVSRPYACRPRHSLYTPRTLAHCPPPPRNAQRARGPPFSLQDGKNSSLAPPRGCEHSPSGWIIERNKARLADPAFAVTGMSSPTGLHYSWTWNVSSQCAIHFVHLNLFPGRECGSASNPAGEGGPPGFPCNDGDLAWAENSLGFLEDDLAAHGGPGVMTVTIQHYGVRVGRRPATLPLSPLPHPHAPFWLRPPPCSLMDSATGGTMQVRFCRPDLSLCSPRAVLTLPHPPCTPADQREELIATLNKYNPLLVLVGHTHSAEMYSYNGTAQGQWAQGRVGFVDVVNAPATQKEDGKGNPLPSEFMALEAAMDSPTASTGTLRVAQRVGSAWGSILGKKTFDCRA